MEMKKTDPLFWDKARTVLTACILAALLLIGGRLNGALNSLQRYETQIGAIVNRLDALTEELSALDAAALASTVNETTAALEEADLPALVGSLRRVADALEEADLAGLAGDVDALVGQARQGLTDAETALARAGETLDALDVESFNAAIRELRAAIEPLAALFSRFT